MIARLLLSAPALSATLLTATTSSAQTVGGAQPAPPSPAAQPQGQPLGGPVIAGVCLLSREAIFANAAVGKAASARLNELTRAAQAEIDAQRPALETEARALEGQSDNAANKQRREALATRLQTLQGHAAHTSREIEATRAKALETIANHAQPVIAQVYGQKKCGLLFDRGAALGGNFANDLTADVVRALDGRIQTITFERERLPQQQPGAAAPAAR
ncbi:periplasmic chaperone for outer membrane proteins Skp [Sphingomonas laterariae]|uniref:Periplasmic chaperone for outer membrane proteins Skp n=1 Tax=Edaphosphingomonas laterariae TaxID=861865 RepID=A0A239KNI8_9SPHN|nr:OmpH family outer membrane protein [Sphingomonas laterariae]SNT19947.1 periplasmic chaperone for outer membrane proteins Skp [Sphingomonas laterariae]